MLSREKWNNLLNFTKLLRVEPYLFLIFFQRALKQIPDHQLLQDKICLTWFNTTVDYCVNLPQLDEHGKSGSPYFKSSILGQVGIFGAYHSYISIVPALFWSLFVGGWVDRYVKARKILMIFSVSAAIIENLMGICLTIKFDANVYLNLLLHLPSCVLGGHIVARIAIMHYMTSTTPLKQISIRIAVLEMCHFVATPIGLYLGGYLLVQKPVFKTGEIRNYTLIYLIALCFEFIALFWIIFMVNEKIARKQEMKIEMKIQGIDPNDPNDPNKQIKLKSDMTKEDEEKHPIRLLFDFQNIKTMVKTFLQKRPNKGRTQLFMNTASLFIIIMVYHGSGHINGLFIQRVYLWKPDKSAAIHSLDSIIHSIATVTVVPLMIKKGVSDIHLCIIGFLVFFLKNCLIGTWLDPRALYISLAITSIGGVSFIGSRSHLTKLVEKNEIGKVISFMSVLDTFAPTFAAAIFPYIFKYTINSYPGLVYHITAFMIIIPICMWMWIDVYTVQPNSGNKSNKAGQGAHGQDVPGGGNTQILTEDNKVIDENDLNERYSQINTEFFKRRTSVIDNFDEVNMTKINTPKT